MHNVRTSRPVPLPLTAIVAFFSALAALAVSNGMAHAHGPAAHAAPGTSTSSIVLKQEMRRLWEDHIVWTRMAIIALEGDTPDKDAAVTRLLRNQVDIGNALKPYFGKAAGATVTKLLREHILIAADVIAAAKAGDTTALADAQKRWLANADAIAAGLHGLNPKHWPLAVLKREMRMHLQLTTAEAVARLQGNWAADVAAYDKVHRHILHMADLLSTGLIELR
jgi:hypothetical protein